MEFQIRTRSLAKLRTFSRRVGSVHLEAAASGALGLARLLWHGPPKAVGTAMASLRSSDLREQQPIRSGSETHHAEPLPLVETKLLNKLTQGRVGLLPHEGRRC
jgi:hypothetical protein